jgi:hypothetical protein
MKKILRKNHIPKGYTYAAVDRDGCAFAYKQRPMRNAQRWYSDRCFYRLDIGDNFDPSDWKNSLVFKE